MELPAEVCGAADDVVAAVAEVGDVSAEGVEYDAVAYGYGVCGLYSFDSEIALDFAGEVALLGAYDVVAAGVFYYESFHGMKQRRPRATAVGVLWRKGSVRGGIALCVRRSLSLFLLRRAFLRRGVCICRGLSVRRPRRLFRRLRACRF